MGEIHELFVLALSLVWFAGATPDCCLMAANSRYFALFSMKLGHKMLPRLYAHDPLLRT